MVNYIGTATPRVDGRAKVTGEAKYAAEFNTSGLAYGSVIVSTIPKGRIARIDAGEALRVVGVLDVLTHENRPRSSAIRRLSSRNLKSRAATPRRPMRLLTYVTRPNISSRPNTTTRWNCLLPL